MWYTIVIYIQRLACRRTNAPSGLRTELAGHCPQELDRPGWQVGTSRVATSFIQYHIKQTLEYLAKISWKHDDIGWHINIRISNIIQYHPISSNIKFGSWFCFFQPRILQSSSSSDSVWIKIWWLDDSQFFCSSLGTLRFPTHPRRRPVKVLPVLAPAYSGDHVARCSGCPWIGRPLNEVWCAFCSLWPKKSI